jgi:Skp family chaperone for outer membrane proteins
MKHIVKIAVLSLAFVGLLTVSAHAQGRLATVDMQKIFKDYWMTKQSQATLQDRAKELDKTKQDLVDSWKKAKEDSAKLLAAANDQAVTAAEREKRSAAAQTKLKDIADMETNIKSFDAQAQTTLDEMRRRLTDNIFTEIRKAVTEKAKKVGYAMVFDTTAMIYNSGENDITSTIIADLNEKAPVELAPKPAEKAKP